MPFYTNLYQELSRAVSYYLDVVNAYKLADRYKTLITNKKQINVNSEIAPKLYETRYNPILEYLARDYQNKTVAELENMNGTVNIDGTLTNLDFLMFLINAIDVRLNCVVNNQYTDKVYVPNVIIPKLTLQMDDPDQIYQYIVKNDYVSYIVCNTNAFVEIDTPNLTSYEYIAGWVDIKSIMPKLSSIILRNTNVNNLLFAPNLNVLKIYNSYIDYDNLKINRVNSVYIENCASSKIILNKFKKATRIEMLEPLPTSVVKYTNNDIRELLFRDTQGITEIEVKSNSLQWFRLTGKADHTRRANCTKVVLDCPNIEYIYLWEGSVSELEVKNVEKLKLLELAVNNIDVTKLKINWVFKSLIYISFHSNNLDKNALEYIVDRLYENIQYFSINKPTIYLSGNPASLEVAGTRSGGVHTGNGCYQYATYTGGTRSEKLTQLSQAGCKINTGT